MSVSNDNRYAITLTEITATHRNTKRKIPEASILKIQNAEDSGEIIFVEETEFERRAPRTYKRSGIDGMIFFTPDVYKFAIAIKDLKERIKFCQSAEKQKFILQLKVNSPVKIPYGSFGVSDGTFRRAFVKYIGCLNELGPGYHFIVTLMKRDWTLVPLTNNVTIPDCVEDKKNSVILSAEHIFDENATNCPLDIHLFHLFRGEYYDPLTRISRQPDISEKLTKSQTFSKINSSSAFQATSNKNTSKTVPEKPFKVNGKNIYVIDSSPDKDNADVQIIQNSRYEDRSAVLLSTKWPECAGPQFELLNGECQEQPTNSDSNLGKQGRSSPRTKSLNLLDHFNQVTANNANKDIPPQKATQSSGFALRNRQLHYRSFKDVVRRFKIPETLFHVKSKRLCRLATVTYTAAQLLRRRGDEELALIFYMRYINMIQFIEKKADFHSKQKELITMFGGKEFLLNACNYGDDLQKSLITRFNERDILSNAASTNLKALPVITSRQDVRSSK